MKTKTTALVIVLFCMTMLTLCGCSSQAGDQGSDKQNSEVSDTSSSALETASTPESSTDLVLGSQVEGGYAIALTNGTDRSITGIAVCASGSDNFSQNLMDSGTSITPGQVITLYTPSLEETTVSDSDIVFRATADIQIDFSDGSQGVVHQLSVSNLKSVTLRYDDGTTYVDYKIGDTTESTLDMERSLAEHASFDAA